MSMVYDSFGHVMSDKLSEMTVVTLKTFPFFILEKGEHKLSIDWHHCRLDTQHPCLKSLGKRSSLCIIDMTAGLGNDSFRFAMAGHRVISCERNKTLAGMLQAAVWHICSIKPQIQWSVFSGDSRQLINDYPDMWPTIDAIMIDPMYEQTQSAKPNKSMQALRAIMQNYKTNLHKDASPATMLTDALTLGVNRVIVKRHRKAKPLGNIKPQISQYAGPKKTGTRYDIYMVNDHKTASPK